MKPPVQFVTTSDGVRIAYWTLGDGPPLLYLPSATHHLHLDWDFAPTRAIYEWLSSKRTLIRFDDRGTGMSQRDVGPSFEAGALDLEAVAGRLSLSAFDILASGSGAVRAVAFAAAQPERVSRLVLRNPLLGGRFVSPRTSAVFALADVDWELYTETYAGLVWGWTGDEERRQYARLMRESYSHEHARQWIAAFVAVDLSEHLAQITAPTLLVISRGSFTGLTADLSARIPGSRLMLVEGPVWASIRDDPARQVAIDEFLSVPVDVTPPSRTASAELSGGMAVILFADIAGSTSLTERLGDAGFRRLARDLDTSLRAIIREASGAPVEGRTLGDGIMALFSSAHQAITAARRCRDEALTHELPLHLGLHAGDVIREDDNAYGGAVNLASRVSAACRPGDILVTATVRDLARTSAGVLFDDRGEHDLKGVADPVRLFAVQEESPGGSR